MSEDRIPYRSKNTHGGARRTADPVRGKSKRRKVMLYDDESIALIAHYGSLTRALRHALLDIPGWIEPAKKATKK